MRDLAPVAPGSPMAGAVPGIGATTRRRLHTVSGAPVRRIPLGRGPGVSAGIELALAPGPRSVADPEHLTGPAPQGAAGVRASAAGPGPGGPGADRTAARLVPGSAHTGTPHGARAPRSAPPAAAPAHTGPGPGRRPATPGGTTIRSGAATTAPTGGLGGPSRPPLAGRWPAGPEVQSPFLRSDLPVGGGVPVLTQFDQNGVVDVTPPRPSPIDARRPAPIGRTSRPHGAHRKHSGHGSPRRPVSATPAQRWQTALRQQPLEQPRPLPGPLMSWARQVSGLSAPRFTAGPATSAALKAAGALGASSGDVVHLPSVPVAPGHVLAHELTHLRQPLARPRFLLPGHDHTLDADERSVRSAVPGFSSRLSAGPVASAGLVGDLPVGGGAGGTGPAGEAGAAARALGGPSPGGVLASGAGLIGGGPVEAAGQLSSAALSQLSGHLDGQLSGLAGDGLGGAQHALTNGLTNGLQDGLTSLPDGPGGAAGPASRALRGLTGQAPGLGEMTAAASSAAGPGPGPGPGGPGSSAPGMSGEQAPGHGAGDLSDQTVDRVVAAVEERVLAELERRGGRYGGLF